MTDEKPISIKEILIKNNLSTTFISTDSIEGKQVVEYFTKLNDIHEEYSILSNFYNGMEDDFFMLLLDIYICKMNEKFTHFNYFHLLTTIKDTNKRIAIFNKYHKEIKKNIKRHTIQSQISLFQELKHLKETNNSVIINFLNTLHLKTYVPKNKLILKNFKEKYKNNKSIHDKLNLAIKFLPNSDIVSNYRISLFSSFVNNFKRKDNKKYIAFGLLINNPLNLSNKEIETYSNYIFDGDIKLTTSFFINITDNTLLGKILNYQLSKYFEELKSLNEFTEEFKNDLVELTHRVALTANYPVIECFYLNLLDLDKNSVSSYDFIYNSSEFKELEEFHLLTVKTPPLET